MYRGTPFTIAVIVASIPGTVARACLVCETGTGEQVRAGVWGDDFGFNLLATLLPFPVLAGIVAAIYFGLPARRWKAVAVHPRKTQPNG